MINNDILRSIRYMLDLSDNKVIEIIRLADPEFAIEKDELRGYLLKEDEPGHVACGDRVMAHFLDGLVIYRRGRDESLPPRPVEKRINNNVVLKKLRVAFQFTDVDMHRAFADAGVPGVQAGTVGAVPATGAQELPPVRRPAAAQFPQGTDPAHARGVSAGRLTARGVRPGTDRAAGAAAVPVWRGTLPPRTTGST
jgi:uncharacterized protein YehS (DUF1456 family)